MLLKKLAISSLTLSLTLALTLAVFIQTGCIFVPIIDGVKKVGLTKSDREALLTPKVKDFQDLVYWSKFQEAGVFIKEDVRGDQLRELSRKYKDYRLVDSKIDFIDFNESGDAATVSVTARRFKVPFYIVEDYAEDQKWEFSLSDGWRFVSAKKAQKLPDSKSEE